MSTSTAGGGQADLLGTNRVDPTGTKTTRGQFVRQFRKRYRRIKGLPEDVPDGQLPPDIPPSQQEVVETFAEWFADR